MNCGRWRDGTSRSCTSPRERRALTLPAAASNSPPDMSVARLSGFSPPLPVPEWCPDTLAPCHLHEHDPLGRALREPERNHPGRSRADTVCLGCPARRATASDGTRRRTVPSASLPGPTPLRYMGRQVTPGYAEKPRSKVRIRRIRCVSMSARCRQSRADTIG